jgi:hypothetical protein
MRMVRASVPRFSTALTELEAAAPICVATQGMGPRSRTNFSCGAFSLGACAVFRWASAINRANCFTRCISSANRAMGCRRRIFNTSFRRRLSINNSLSATGRTSAFPADEQTKTHDTDVGRMTTSPIAYRSWSITIGTSAFPDSFVAFGKGLLRGIGVWNARPSPSRVYSLAVGVGFGPALLFAL